jgi:biopolymer transport protein ExbD
MKLLSRARSLHHRTDAELNLIPLIDILSVMVAFLLLYSTEVEIVQNSKGVEIPQSIAETQPERSVVVMVTKDQLFVQGELIASVAELGASEARLFEKLREVLERPMLAADAAAADPALAPRQITLMGDKALPYAVLKKVMETCTAAAYGKISLAVLEKEKPVHTARPNPV